MRVRTPLYDEHIAAGAKMTSFYGWELPLHYCGVLAEHASVRSAAGIFDVSHMGEIYISGRRALETLQKVLTHDMRRLESRPWLYSPVCNENGGVIDDVIVYRYKDGFLLCVNASNTLKDLEWLRRNAPKDVAVEDISHKLAQIAVQGPSSAEILSKTGLSSIDFKADTGYTGERGCELYLAPEDAPGLWRGLIAAGAKPCGLGARDLLRTEAALPLYSHELSEDISPLEAGLARFVCFDKGDFIGRRALLEMRESKDHRRLIGLTVQSRAIPRAGCEVLCGGRACGIVTSGGVSPALGCGIAMALVSGADGEYTVVIRGKEEPAKITKLPFYRRRG
jgi:aminomethyltransferase